ncbi:hypothetical protein [Natrinema halophilum]|uniref:hypothetical protein n=1 Tax=Natrinema halophilum TaxID=1699371 RepID=UPI001F1CA13F|nr:hypothetical protein [Natrinema halophilum]UHQ96130.1 hypothetical protein HYG82_22675 [Natrinema halophilum]
MKKGTGSDPFADMGQDDTAGKQTTEEKPTDEATDDEPDSKPDRQNEESESTAEAKTTTDETVTERETGSNDSIVDDPPQNSASDSGVPWVYVRDNVKQDREMVQFYLRDYVTDAESDFVDAVSEELGTDVSKTDVREAAYEAAMYNVDDVVDRLRDWGFESVD